MFADSNTHKQCLAIYGGIFSSDLSKTLPVPFMLIKEIAEYSTGKLKQCMGANKQCKECDEKKFGEYGKSEKFGYYKYGNDYFCCNECIGCTECGLNFDKESKK